MLHWFALFSLEIFAKEGFKKGSEVDALDSSQNSGKTALLEIARHPNGSSAVVNCSSKNGADANKRGNQWFGFRSPLHECVLRGDPERVEILLDHAANSRLKDYVKQEPVDIALRNKNIRMVTLLRERETFSNYGETALHIAASKDHRDVVRLLLRNKADVGALTLNNETPLHWAASAGNSETLLLLLDPDANMRCSSEGLETSNVSIDMIDSDGSTPLILAAAEGHHAIVQLLLDHNSDQSVLDRVGDTALHVAVCRDHVETVRCLLSRVQIYTKDQM